MAAMAALLLAAVLAGHCAPTRADLPASSLFPPAYGPAGSEVADPCEARFDAAFTAALFPAGFQFGTATSATQVEGAAFEGGRGPSIWDAFAATPGNIADNSTSDIAANQYHMFREDVKLMKELGTTMYRFSISWSRILPKGTGEVNPTGIAYYNALIDALLAEGISPAVTLYHWDLPLYLEETMGAWLNASIVDYFMEYADLCFRSFGDRVQLWMTFNEPGNVATEGYASGEMPPQRCSDAATCPNGGDSSSEPYIVAHNILRSHAYAVELYRSKYQAQQGGRIGMVLQTWFLYPLTNSTEDEAASERGMQFNFGWFAEPLVVGDYPAVMRQLVGARLPEFSPLEQMLLKNSTDFFGLNFYTARYASAALPPAPENASILTDPQINLSETNALGVLIGTPSASEWLLSVPNGIYSMIMWVSARYSNIPILITENGVSDSGNVSIPTALCDQERITYMESYLKEILQAINEGALVEAYLAWAFVDNWEWAEGFSQRFGLLFVDFAREDRPRRAKMSAIWYARFLRAP